MQRTDGLGHVGRDQRVLRVVAQVVAPARARHRAVVEHQRVLQHQRVRLLRLEAIQRHAFKLRVEAARGIVGQRRCLPRHGVLPTTDVVCGRLLLIDGAVARVDLCQLDREVDPPTFIELYSTINFFLTVV